MVDTRLNNYLERDLESLYLELGKKIIRNEGILFEMKSESPYIKKAKNFLEGNLEDIRDIVCQYYDKNRNDIDDLDKIIAVLTTKFGFDTTFYYVLVSILIKRGLQNICNVN
jgi:hypothetical protein